MKKFIFIVLFLLFPIFIYSEYFHVEQYNVNVIINKDSSVYFEENILVNFHTYRHGIYRWIPIKWGKHRFRSKIISIESSLNGKKFSSEKYKTWKRNGWIYIRIGKKNKTIKGLKYYKIVYKIYNAIINNTFYWNVIGTGWKVPIKDANISILFPEATNLHSLQHFAYKGIWGSTKKIDYNISNSSMEINNVSLGPKEAITVKLIFPKGLILPVPPFKKFIWWLSDHFGYFIPFFVFLIVFYIWLKFGKDEKKGSIVVQYEPPEGYTPGELGTLIDDKVDSKDIAATIVDLAVKGYIKIEKKVQKILLFSSKDFIIKKLPGKDISKLKEHEKIIYNGLFESGTSSVTLKELKKDFYQSVNKFKKQMYNYLSNKEHLYTINPKKLRHSFWVIAILFVWFAIFTENFFFRADFFTGMIISGIIIGIFSFIMPQKSHKGTQIYRKILGFKEFLEKVEKPKLKILAENDPDIFNKMLPYAIAFGVEKKWSKKFEGLNINPPYWYGGYYSGADFSTHSFINDLQSDIGSLTSGLTSTSGGSTGGGFSGGGGGGGGGGSW